MRRIRRLALTLAAVLVAAFLLALIVPLPPLQGTRPPEELADADSRFAVVNGVRVHYKVMGTGEPVFVLLHGFAASVFSWREVMGPLSAQGTVIAFDRPASGLTERPLPGEWTGRSPYSLDAQVDLTIGLMDSLAVRRAILVGNSAGGTVAALTALRYPERVQSLILVSPAIYSGGGAPGIVSALLRLPVLSRFGPLLLRPFASAGETLGRTAWHDPSRLTPEIWAGYKKPLQADNWDRGLWELTIASQPSGLPSQLPSITLPVLVITGDDDRIVPTSQSIRLAGELPDARLVVIPQSGHVAHEETPAEFLAAVRDFLATAR
jgi:pimeloyl-ACP methyl ester carboxylesterase